MSDELIRVEGLVCGYRGHAVLKDLSFSIGRGELVCLLGPNGVGKTTLFKTLMGLLPALAGRILIEGEEIGNWSRQRLALAIGYVPQAHQPPFPFRVLDVVATGRAAHIGLFASPGREDLDIARQSLETLGIQRLAERIYTQISGGERQLVLIARALAQQAKLLVMDEPTSNLDFGNQVRVLAHIRDIVERDGLSVLLTTHHPDHALQHGSRVLALDSGQRLGEGRPEEVITADYMRSSYRVETEIATAGEHRARVCLPIWKRA